MHSESESLPAGKRTLRFVLSDAKNANAASFAPDTGEFELAVRQSRLTANYLKLKREVPAKDAMHNAHAVFFCFCWRLSRHNEIHAVASRKRKKNNDKELLRFLYYSRVFSDGREKTDAPVITHLKELKGCRRAIER